MCCSNRSAFGMSWPCLCSVLHANSELFVLYERDVAQEKSEMVMDQKEGDRYILIDIIVII